MTPADAIKFRMEQAGIARRDLVPLLGTKSRVSEILSGQRQLTMDQIRALHRHFGIPPAALMQHGRSTAARDRFDVNRCDAMLVNLLGAKFVSIGTVGEVFWADAYRKPVVLIREVGNIHTHAMMDALTSWIVPNLDQGLEIIEILLAYE